MNDWKPFVADIEKLLLYVDTVPTKHDKTKIESFIDFINDLISENQRLNAKIEQLKEKKER